ncbi:histamine H2 receptor-like [Mytilus edulis]|uniref:histamine H2 receptor-like n=1 Tax=Mytilus edulis TaxID=6550 RepID=UPI0039EF3217
MANVTIAPAHALNITTTTISMDNGSSLTTEISKPIMHWRLEYIHLGLVFLFIELIIFLPIIFGNTLILISIFKFKRLRTRINMLIANLATSDLLIGTVMIPYDLFFIFNAPMRHDKYTCLLRYTFETSFLGSSVLNLLVISIERYLAIMYPLQHASRATRRWLISLMASSWIISIFVACLPLLGWNSWYPGIPCDSTYINPKSYKGLIFLFFIGSIIANFVMYVKVVKIAFSQINAIQSEKSAMTEDTFRHVRVKKNNIKKTKMMILVLGVFAVCWGPYCVTLVFETLFLEPSDNLEMAKKCLACFGLINSGLNWIIFGVKNSSFRKAFKYILCCGAGQRDSLVISSTAK